MLFFIDWRFEMIGIYFSGTGNSRYALEVFLSKYDEKPEYGTGCGEGGG